MSTTAPTARTAGKAPAAKAPVASQADATADVRRKRELVGVVVSNKMDKTCVVQVTRRFRHAKYKKYVNERKRYKAHDERNEAGIGDRVIIVECRPLSREKRWRLQSVLEKAEAV